MSTYTLGQIGLNPRGVYNTNTAYKHLDFVIYNGSSYVALSDNTGVPPTDNNTWMLLAAGAAAEPVWNPLSLFTGSMPGTYGTGNMRFKKIGNHVFIAGSVNVTPGFNIVLCNIPDGYRPVFGTATVLNPCQGSRIARIAVNTDGDFRLEWVKNISDGSSVTSGTVWVECSIDYWITGA